MAQQGGLRKDMVAQNVSLKDLVSGSAPKAHGHGGHHGFDTSFESFDFHGDSLPRKHRELEPVGPAEILPCTILDEVARMSLWKWFMTLITAVVIGLSTGGLLLASHQIVHDKVTLMDKAFRSEQSGVAFAIWMVYGVGANLIAGLMVCHWEPSAGGSGIPDVKSYANGVIMPGVLSFRAYFVRVVGLTLVTSSGVFAGTEGPIAHIGAVVATGIPMGRSTYLKKRLRLQEDLNSHKVKIEFLGMGAAMGVAAAFGAPIGGLLFSLEEASTHWNTQLTWRTFFGCCIAAVVTKSVKGGFRTINPAGFLEFPTHTSRNLSAFRDIDDINQVILGDPVRWQPWEFIPFIFIAVCLGFLGAFFCWCVKMIQMQRIKVFKIGQKGKVRKWGRVGEVLFMAVVSLGLCYILAVAMPCQPNPWYDPSMVSSGQSSGGSGRRMQASDLIADEHNMYLNFRIHTYDAHCPPGKSSAMAMYFFESKEFAIKALFSDEMENGIFTEAQLVIMIVSSFVFTLMTYGAGVPAGLFVPNIMTGACFGRLIGQIVKTAVEDIQGPDVLPLDRIHVNPGVYALIGATSMLGGFARMTMSLAVIVLEITTNLFMTLPIMVVIVVSKSVGDLFGASAYDIVVALKNVPLLEPEIETTGWKKLGELPCKCIGCPQGHLDFIEFSATFLVADAVKKLTSNRHHAWPVVENSENMRLLGLLTRPKLLQCLADNQLLPSETEELNLQKISENDEELNIWPYVSQDAFILLHRTSVLTAHTIFRNIGLRHLCIVDENHAIVSLITRKDLCEVVEEFVSDYKVALKEFAEKIQASTHELDGPSQAEIDKGFSDFTLESGGVPKGPVDYDTRADLRERRQNRQRANSETSVDSGLSQSKSPTESPTKSPQVAVAPMQQAEPPSNSHEIGVL